MSQVHKYVRKNYTFDTYAARKAALWLKTGAMTDYEKIMLEIFNILEIKRFAEAFEPLSRAQHLLLSTKSLRFCFPLLPLISFCFSLEPSLFFSICLSRNVRQLLPVTESHISDEIILKSGANLSPDDVVVTNDSSALYMYCLGRAFRGVGKLKEAMECYQVSFCPFQPILPLFPFPYSFDYSTENPCSGVSGERRHFHSSLLPL